jgi:hypothetical protein
MSLIVRTLALATLLASATVSLSAHAQARPTLVTPASSNSPLLTTDRVLQASLARISRGSALWREAFAAVGKSGRRVLVLTSADSVMVVNGPDGRRRRTFDHGVLAEAVPVFDEHFQISTVVIVVNLRLVQQLHDVRLSVPRDVEADLDRILVHEVYGHAVPYLLAGDVSGRCADPQEGESAAEACSIRRENAVRAELGLGRRADPGLYSLKLAMGTR